MFLWGIIFNIFLFIYALFKKDSLKIIYVYLSGLIIYYLLIFKIPIFTLKNSILEMDIFKFILLAIMLLLLNFIITLFEKSKYFEDDMIDALFNHLESKVIFIFVFSLFILTDYILINIILLIFIYLLLKIPKHISYISINLLLILSIVQPNSSSFFGGQFSSNYLNFVNRENFIFLVILLISLLIILAMSFAVVNVEKNLKFNNKYLLYIFSIGVINVFFYKNINSDAINFILLIVTFISCITIEKKDNVIYKRKEDFPIIIPYFIVLYIILFIREFVDYPVIILLSGVCVLLFFDRQNKHRVYINDKYRHLLATILLLFSFTLSLNLSNSTLTNNLSMLGNFKDFYTDIINSTPSLTFKFLKTISFSGYIFPSNIDAALISSTLIGSYKMIFSINIILLASVPVQFLIINGLKMKDYIKENIFIVYLIFFTIGIIIIYI